MRGECVGEQVGAVGVAAAVGEGARLPFGVGFDDEAAEVGDGLVHLVHGRAPPRTYALVQRVGGVKPAQDEGRGEADGEVGADAVRPQLACNGCHFTDAVGEEVRLGLVDVDVVDAEGVDPAGRQQPRVRPHPRQVAARPPVLPEDRSARVATLDLSHDGVDRDVVPVVEHAQGEGGAVGPRGRVRERGLSQAYDLEVAVEQTCRVGGRDRGAAARPLQGEAVRAFVAGLVQAQQQIAHAVVVNLRTAELRAGVRDFVPDRVDEGAVTPDPDPPRTERAQRLVGQPCGVDPVAGDKHGRPS